MGRTLCAKQDVLRSFSEADLDRAVFDHDPIRGRLQNGSLFARQLRASSGHDAREGLATLTMPTHVIGGERDILIPVWKTKEIASLIPDSKLTILPGAPHGLSVERAEEFNAAVLGFIREAAAAPAA